ncbi:beta strand repeat-containing protein, partial [Helicobacter pullorum]|uniref:beta strand repeat-containing protein n=1 Tax=Helicobacter pullorum TaxID=35818 RepID=UPI000A6E4EBC
GQKPLNNQSLETKNPKNTKNLESNLKLDSKTLQEPCKIKELNKAKTLIRTIPVSIALASALSSNAAALSTENGELVDEVIMSGRPTLTVNGTIKNGTIINGISTIKNNTPGNTNRGNKGGSIINGWDLKYSSWSTPGVIVNNSKDDNAGGVLVTGKFSFAYGDYGHTYEVLAGTKAGNLTFDTGTSFTVPNHGYGNFVNIISVSENASAATIANKGTIAQNTSANIINLASNSTTDAIVNSGTITSRGNNLLTLKANATLGILKNSDTMSTTGANLINLSGGNNSIEQIELLSGSTTSAGTNIISAESSATIGTITADNATINGGISLSNTSSITNGISLSNTSALTGNISLTNNSRIQGGIVLDNSKITGGITLGGSSNIAGISLANASTITGGVTLNGSSSIDNISISGSNASLSGNITMLTPGNATNTASIDNITISNGGTFGGTIHTAGQTNISGITIANGGVVGSNTANSMILSSGNSTIHNIDIQNGGTMYGNIEAHWQTGGNANAVDNKDGNIGDVSIAGRLQGDIVLQTKVFMNSLTMSENGTITGNIRIGATGDSSQTPTLSTITLGGNSGINAITLGGIGARATINSLTLNDNSSIGTITNNSNATIVNLTLNETSTITNGITNEANGNIGTIISNTNANVSNTINNEGTIAKLLLNQGTINYSGNSGFFKEELVVGRDATLTINNGGSGNGTLYFNSTSGTIDNAGTILGNIDNQASSIIKSFNTGSISGSIINNASATIETLNVTSNVGSIANSGDINSLTIQSGSNIANGITNNSNIGSLIVNENVSYSGSGSISNALEVAQGDTLTIGSNGTLNFDSDNGTINNAGTINGNITNIADSILTDFTNSGSISGTFTNEGHIVKFVNTDTGNINTFTNNNTISFFENNGTIANFGGTGTIYGVINSKTITNGFENVATSLWNKENALISGNVALKGDYKDCSNSGSTICNTSDLINEGTITGNVTNDTGKEINLVENTGTIGGSIANSGSINTFKVSGTIVDGIINNDNASISSITINKGANLGSNGITNNSNIGTFIVNESVSYNGNGSDRITQALEVAKDKTLTIGSNGTLSFNSKNGSVNNLGTIAGNLANVSNSTLANFTNFGTTSQINGSITNSGLITRLENQGTISNSITNNANATITSFHNSGTINGDINNEGTITSIDNSGVITGEIVSGSSGQTSQIDKIINTGTIGTAKTKVATFKTLVASNQNVSSNFNDAISLNTITTTEISNGGLVNGNIRVKGQSDIQELNNTNTIDGCIILEGGRIGNINNTNGAIANCMHFSNGADVGGLNNDGTISGTITNNSGNITIDNSGSISGITTSNGGTTNISNGGFKNSGGNIGLITNTGSNSTTNIIEWNVGNPDNPKSPIKVAGDNLGGINTGTIYVDVTPGKVYDVEQIVTDGNGSGVDANGNSLADQLNNG